MIILVVTILTLVTLVIAGVSIHVVIDGLQGPSRSDKLLIRFMAMTAGFVMVAGMLSSLVYCGVALFRFLSGLA